MQGTSGQNTSTGMHIHYIIHVEYLFSIKGIPGPNMLGTPGQNTSTGMHINYITHVE